MTEWPLHTPERGSVAGLTSATAPAEHIVGTPSPQRHAPAPIAKKRAKEGSAQDAPPT